MRIRNAAEARDSRGEIRVSCASSLDEALQRADAQIRAFVGDRDFVIEQTRAAPLLQCDGGVMGWDVEVSWRVIS